MMRWLRNRYQIFLVIGFPFLLLLILFRSLLFQIDRALFDWNDYPLYVWIMYQNIAHIPQFDFSHFYNGAIFHPLTHTLLFSDLFLPQSLLAWPLTLIISNPILVFNIIFFFSLFLNVVAARYLWSAFFKDWQQLFFATTATVISSFIFQNWYHFQILSLWPLLLALGLFLRSSHTWKKAIQAGFLMSLVFYSSVYYWIFLITILSIWYPIKILYSPSRIKEVYGLFFFLIVTATVFTTLSGVTLWQYWQTRQLYNAQREYGEYVTYAAHLSDYLFPAHMSSIGWSTAIARSWNQFNQHSGVFPGITLLSLAAVGLITVWRKKQLWIGIKLTQHTIFFLIMVVMGGIFSLGPRLNFNGIYLVLPLPYHFLLKNNPLFEVIRVTSRWSILFFLGLIYFATLALSKKRHLKVVAVTVIAVLLHLI